jgi:hypothetical protein
MFRPVHGRASGRLPSSFNAVAVTRQTASHKLAGRRQALRARGWGETNARLPFMPPETWHEPREAAQGFRVVVEAPGTGYRHVVTPDEVRERLARFPAQLVKPLQVVQLSGMTRKKQGLPLYGMQWGSAVYLYPIEANLVETYDAPPKPAQLTEARMYGGRWKQAAAGKWHLVWTPESIKDFYLNNILIHELGHILDDRNTGTVDRERFAEWFAVEYGYLPTQAERRTGRGPVVRRHG